MQINSVLVASHAIGWKQQVSSSSRFFKGFLSLTEHVNHLYGFILKNARANLSNQAVLFVAEQESKSSIDFSLSNSRRRALDKLW
jgi:hypothetical protein